MKGAIFNALQELVEREYGYQVWDDAITHNTLVSEGIYTSTKQYDDSELFTIVDYLSARLNTPVADMTKALGVFLFPLLIGQAPKEAQQASSLRSFLLMVDDLIHVEVKKLNKDAQLPEFDYQSLDDNSLIMLYRSPRKLCYLSEGLIAGAATHFDADISVSQHLCMHDGADHCEIKVTFNE